MAVPRLFLLLPSLFYTHPVSQWWRPARFLLRFSAPARPNHGSMTDWEILSEVWPTSQLFLNHF